MEMPRLRSISIQSEVTPRRPDLPCTAPAESMRSAYSASASVRVDLPASGWLITAKVRRRRASVVTSVMSDTTLRARKVLLLHSGEVRRDDQVLGDQVVDRAPAQPEQCLVD